MRRILVLLLSFCSCFYVYAYNLTNFSWNIKTSINSSYLWHGECYGGLSCQQDLSIGYKGLELGIWINEGDGSNWDFNSFNPELDTRIGYSIFGASLILKHYYYFDGGFFDFSNDHKNSQLLTRLEYDFNTLDLCNLKLGIMVTCLGGWNNNSHYNQVWIDGKYDFVLPVSEKTRILFTPSFGICPNKIHEDYSKHFSFNELTFKLTLEYNPKDNMTIDIHTHIMTNTYKMMNINNDDDFVYFNFGMSFSFWS